MRIQMALDMGETLTEQITYAVKIIGERNYLGARRNLESEI